MGAGGVSVAGGEVEASPPLILDIVPFSFSKLDGIGAKIGSSSLGGSTEWKLGTMATWGLSSVSPTAFITMWRV
jgi:hypothetical protein